MWIDDDVIAKCREPIVVDSWIPRKPIIVLGRSNEASSEVYCEKAQKDGVEVLQRYGGGGTVILYPGCVVLSIGTWVKDRFRNDYFFHLLNLGLIELLEEAFPVCRGRLAQDGISDITLDGRKIAGTSLFRSRNYLLYQASLIVNLNIEMIEAYLPHPSKEPPYRARRRHADFLTGLANAGEGISVHKTHEFMVAHANHKFLTKLEADLMEVQDLQVPHLFRKMAPPLQG